MTETLAGVKLPKPEAIDLSIDRTLIEDSLAAHAGTWAYVAVRAERHRLKREGLEVQVKRKAAELNRRIREDKEAEGEKVTEAKLTAAVLEHEEYQELVEAVATEGHLEREAGILRDALSSRKGCLEMLARLKIEELANTNAGTGPEAVSETTKKLRDRKLRAKGR